MTIDKCEFKNKKLELISGSYCHLQLLSELQATTSSYTSKYK